MLLALEIGAAVAGLVQGVLVMLDRRSNWIIYVLQMILMVIFSACMHLYGDVVNNLIYIPLGIFGFLYWNRPNKTKITACTARQRILYLSVIALCTVGAYLILRSTNDPLPLLDAFTTVSSLVATFLMVVKKTDTWMVWFVNDIFYAVEYFLLPDQALYLFLLNLLWTGMAVASYISWRRIMKQENME